MTVTILDVARLAGVSTATVSRVLHSSNRVSPETRGRVETAVRTLQYRPSAIARSLAAGATRTIGIMVSDVTNPYYPEMVAGMEDAAHAAGYNIFLCTSRDDPGREKTYLELLMERRADGVIVASSGLSEQRPTSLQDLATPLVLVNSDGRGLGVPSVSSDNYGGARDLTRYLLRLGHRRIAHISGPTTSQSTGERVRGYTDALRSAGVEPETTLLVASEGDAPTGESAMLNVLSSGVRPGAVFAYNDLAAIGALHACYRAGVQVPQDISLAGFDNIQLSGLIRPPLTTMAQATGEMGRLAVEQLISIVEGRGSGSNILLPCTLIERESTSRCPQS